eukprot:CAMPEP_0115676622 /NCGR_PEP_ID=MMETSP0272-20121206/54790_1 /TAXON_ID=71861 /ORGANISM="Scrippsiella trochoidea, Strain CCMP3099" /LENGTH=104 /DNA_ID=CAMNT_0003115685 /DNA_START=821 /DNA_END=1135 /DNA_ORIENTATION=+
MKDIWVNNDVISEAKQVTVRKPKSKTTMAKDRSSKGTSPQGSADAAMNCATAHSHAMEYRDHGPWSVRPYLYIQFLSLCLPMPTHRHAMKCMQKMIPQRLFKSE